jgi:AcrR family transcriptional regulator
VSNDRGDSFVAPPSDIVYTVHKKLAKSNGQCPHEIMTKRSKSNLARRSTYRHGDLRHALLAAGIDLARAGGPDAIVLREATRRAGVVPNAAYRHFANRQELLQAVRSAALTALAVAMEEELAKLSGGKTSADFARASLRAVGTGYLSFAQAETGLFRTAFAPSPDLDEPAAAIGAGDSGLNPFELLAAALDRLVEAGVLPPADRPNAEYFAWSAVHGMALLTIEGPLRRLAPAETHALGQRLLDMIEKGL